MANPKLRTQAWQKRVALARVGYRVFSDRRLQRSVVV